MRLSASRRCGAGARCVRILVGCILTLCSCTESAAVIGTAGGGRKPIPLGSSSRRALSPAPCGAGGFLPAEGHRMLSSLLPTHQSLLKVRPWGAPENSPSWVCFVGLWKATFLLRLPSSCQSPTAKIFSPLEGGLKLPSAMER